MKVTESSIRSPVAVAVGVILVCMFGLVGLFDIPIQLTPDVDKPRISVSTIWPGASPPEIEREIVDRQEEYLKNVEGVLLMRSECQDNRGTVSLEFPAGTDIAEKMIRVRNALDQVPEYPLLADKPVITSVDQRANAIAWFMVVTLPGNDRDITSYRDLCEDVIKPAFERVEGVAASNVFGGAEREMVVTLDPLALSARGITIGQLVAALRRENRNITAGDFDEGKNRYVVRTVAEFETPEDIANAVIVQRGDRAVYVRDVATVGLGFKETQVTVRQYGIPSIAMNVQRAPGSNILEVMEGLRETTRELNDGPLKDQDVFLRQSYDATVYVESALGLVRQNMVLGGFLAVYVLLLFLGGRRGPGVIALTLPVLALIWLVLPGVPFLREGLTLGVLASILIAVRSVLVIAVAIPISVVGTFLVMFLMGRNINVISLAGMSFAIGMVVDNSIVVLENIYRHLQMGKGRRQAALDGTKEVWGAILASTLTTMAVFIPVLFMVDRAGQLFRDIALAISAAVGLSLVVSITVIPTMAARVMEERRGKSSDSAGGSPGWAGSIADSIARFIHALCGSFVARLTTVLVLTTAAVLGAWMLLPPAEYLPEGNRNLAIGFVVPPPGYNLPELTEMAKRIERGLSPHFLEYEGVKNPRPKHPVIGRFFFVARSRQVFLGAIAEKPEEIREIIPIMQRELAKIPGLIPIVKQTSLFGRIGEGRAVKLQITGPDLERLVALGSRINGMVYQILPPPPKTMVRPEPSLDLGNPEVRIRPDRELTSKLGLTAEDLGIAVDVLLDGRKISDLNWEGREIDLVLKGRESYTSRTQDFQALPITAEGGRLVTLGDVASVEVGTGPEQINRIERERSITLLIFPPRDVAIETAMNDIQDKIVRPLEEEGAIGGLYRIRLAGTVNDLVETRKSLQGKLLLALAITFLLMAALFESFLYPLVIMFSVPLAAVGGFGGLYLVNLFVPQPLDVLTMLGFVILVGTVVNNAILIVHQALNLMKTQGLAPREAIRDSVRTRIRPIFMSMMTSVCGMLPLVLLSGAGSELYRGLGSVVVGGLVFSTIFTLFLVPTLFSLVLEMKRRLADVFRPRPLPTKPGI